MDFKNLYFSGFSQEKRLKPRSKTFLKQRETSNSMSADRCQSGDGGGFSGKLFPCFAVLSVFFLWFLFGFSVQAEEGAQALSENPPSARAERFLTAAKKVRKARFRRDKSKLPSVRIAPARKGRKLPLKDIRPPEVSRLYYEAGTDEAELESVINEEMAYLFKLLKRNRTGELLLRLGSLYVDKARFISFKIQSDYNRKTEEFEKGLRKSRPYLNLKPATVYNRKAVRLFDEFKRRYPRSPRMDEVLFFLGFNSYQLNRVTAGAKYFHELENRYPRSEYVYEAHFQLGEHYFKKKNWVKAGRYYGRVARKKQEKFYFFALYKLAWCQYKRGFASKGLNLLERIIKQGRGREQDAKSFAFVSEAVEDLVLFYTYSKKPPSEAPSYFHRLLSDGKAEAQLAKLAESYKSVGDTRGVISLFSYIIEKRPLSPEACEHRYQMIQTLYYSATKARVIKYTKEWIKHCGSGGSWAEAHSDDEELIRKTREKMELTLRKYSLRNHQLFRKSRTDSARRLALNFYKIYFSEFEDTEHTDQMRFFYGELLFDSGKYTAAVKKYEEIISKYPKGKYTSTAYTNQILALEKILPKDKEIKKIAGDGKEATELPPQVHLFIKRALRYLQKFPNKKNSSSILYRVGGLYYSFGHLDESAAHLKNLYDKYPAVPYISDVGGLLLDIYNRKKDYPALKALASRFTSNKRIDKALIREAGSILQQFSFKQAQDLAVEGKHKESAVLYETFAQKHPASPLASSSYYNSAVNYEKSDDIRKAISMYYAVLAYKNAPLKIRKKARKFLPVLNERLGFYWKAAEGYAAFAGKFPKDSKAVGYWYNAGVIYDGFNRVDKAVFAYNKYFQLNGGSERFEVLYLTARLYDRNRQWAKAVNYYDRYSKSAAPNRSRQVQSVFRTAEIFERHLKNPAKADALYEKTIAYYRRLKTGASFSARAEMRRARKVYDKFKSARIVGAKNQSSAVDRKIQLLKTLDNALKPVIRYDDREQIIASLALSGTANRQMAQAIFSAPLPKGLNKEGKKQYREGIKKIIDPYLKKAVKSYKLAVKKSKKFKIYSESLREAYDGLRRINIRRGVFKDFSPPPVPMEVLGTALFDDTKMMSDTFLSGLGTALKYRISREEKTKIFQALKSGKESAVLKAVSRILNKSPDNVFAVNALGLFYLNHRKPRMGVLVMNRVLAKKPDIAPLLNNIGVVFLKGGDVREAAIWLKKALEADPSDMIANANLGTIFVKNGDFSNALVHLEKAYDRAAGVWKRNDSRLIAVFNNYGVALAGAGEWKSARLLYEGMTKQPSPPAKVLLNQAIVLTEGFDDRRSANLAKGLVDELHLSRKSVRFKRKLGKIANKLKRRGGG